jgi:hypothetical protein
MSEIVRLVFFSKKTYDIVPLRRPGKGGVELILTVIVGNIILKI